MAKKREKTLWMWFSRYIRLRDCMENGVGLCISCGEYVHFGDAHAGHYIPQGGHYNVMYDENNSSLQCARCNCVLSGNVEAYRVALIEKVGIEEVERLESIGGDLCKNMPKHEVDKMTAKYKRLAREEAYKQGVEL